MPQIEVEFAIDANGILNVSATDKGTGKSQDIEITGSSGLSEEEIEQMKKDAEEHASDDESRRAVIDAKNEAESIVYATKKSLEEYGDKVGAEDRGNIETAISNLEDKLKGDDIEAIKSAMTQLNEASLELGKAVYEATKESGGDTGDKAKSDDDEDVIDAEYEVKDDK